MSADEPTDNRNARRTGRDKKHATNNPSNLPVRKDQAGEGGARSDEAERETEHRQNERALVRWTRAVAFLTGGLVFVGIITGYIFKRQLDVMKGQLDAMERDQRPFLGLVGPDIPHLVKLPAGSQQQLQKVAWSWQYANFGKSVAKAVAADQFMKLADGPFVRVNLNHAASGDVPPGKINYGTAISLNVVDDNEFARLMGLDGGIAVLVELEYFDEPGQRYTNAFCLTHLATGAAGLLNPADCKK